MTFFFRFFRKCRTTCRRKLSISERKKFLRGNCKVSQNGFPFLRHKVAWLQPTLHLISSSFTRYSGFFSMSEEFRTNFRIYQTIMWLKLMTSSGTNLWEKFEISCDKTLCCWKFILRTLDMASCSLSSEKISNFISSPNNAILEKQISQNPLRTGSSYNFKFPEKSSIFNANLICCVIRLTQFPTEISLGFSEILYFLWDKI